MTDPTTLGRYQITGTLGKGAMGVVYKAYDPVIERLVAIKTVRKDLADHPLAGQIVERFRNEAKAAGRLVHPNIVGVYEYGEDDTVAFIVMEYVEGTGLRDYLSRRVGFDYRQIVAIMKQLLLALDFAHERAVIHRDIKPTNLILTAKGTLKLADFGIAHVDSTDLTISGTVLGTPSYMSPEQIQGRPIDGRSDLFSAGVVLYELLTSERPFDGTLATIAYKICHENPAPPSQSSGLKLPTLVDAVVARALAKAPEARYQTGRELSDALEQALKTPSEPARPVEEIVPSPADMDVPLPVPVPWEDAVLRSAERRLAEVVGPMARVMVRNAATKACDLVELYALLSESIADAGGRRRFLEAAPPAPGSGPGTPSGRQPATERGSPPTPGPRRSGDTRQEEASTSAPLEAAFVDHTAAKLAFYLGPVASWVTKKAAQRAGSRQELVHFLADQLGAQDRRAFLRDVGFPDV